PKPPARLQRRRKNHHHAQRPHRIRPTPLRRPPQARRDEPPRPLHRNPPRPPRMVRPPRPHHPRRQTAALLTPFFQSPVHAGLGASTSHPAGALRASDARPCHILDNVRDSP